MRPRRGENIIGFSVMERPAGLECGVVLEYVELLVSYNMFPRANAASKL